MPEVVTPHIEIERRFLVKPKAWSKAQHAILKKLFITQGYLSVNPRRIVRIRMTSQIIPGVQVPPNSDITIKGRKKNASCLEYAYTIPNTDAERLLALIKGHLVVKERRICSAGNSLNWEVDFFERKNKGLVIAEIELPTEETVFDKPDWIGEEVTNDQRYSNSALAIKPFSNW